MKMSKRAKYVAVLVAALIGGIVLTWAILEHEEDRHHFHTVCAGVLYRSRQPDAENFEGLKRRNITKVVNLRHRDENVDEFDREQALCAAKGVTMINLPMLSSIPADEQLERFLQLVRDGKGATLVHCQHGRNRTGVMSAAFRVVVEGVEPQRAYDEMMSYWDRGPVPEDARRNADRRALLGRLSRDRQDWLKRTSAAPATQP